MKTILSMLFVFSLSVCLLTPAGGQNHKKVVVWVPPLYDVQALEIIARESGYSVDFIKPDVMADMDVFEAAPEEIRADLVIVPHPRLGEFTKLIEPIRPLIEEKVNLDQFHSAGKDALSIQGELYGVPLTLDTPLLVYNKNLFREAGLTKAPETWEEWINYSKKIGSVEGKYGFMYDASNVFYAGAFFSGCGADIFSIKGIQSQEALTAAEAYSSLFEKGIVPRNADYSTMNSLFKQGKVGMVLSGPWSLKEYKAMGIEYGLSKIPQLPNEKDTKPFMTVYGICLTNFAINKNAAVEFVTLVSQPKNLVRLANLEGKAPALRFEYLKESDVGTLLNADLMVVAEQASVAKPLPDAQTISTFISPISSALHAISTETKSPEQALDDASKAMEDKIGLER